MGVATKEWHKGELCGYGIFCIVEIVILAKVNDSGLI
jgi:hypothetical protein